MGRNNEMLDKKDNTVMRRKAAWQIKSHLLLAESKYKGNDVQEFRTNTKHFLGQILE